MKKKRLRRTFKRIFHIISLILVSPASLCCWLEKRFAKGCEEWFLFWSHVFALLPGLPGLFLRRAFYVTTLSKCTMDCFIGFGALFTHRTAVVEKDVYVGAYSIIGSATLKEGTLIGSRVSILSGKYQHELDANGHWMPCDLSRLTQLQIGPHAWIGEGALVMANVNRSALVAAGAVVSSSVPPGIIVAGNPARFVKKIWEPEGSE